MAEVMPFQLVDGRNLALGQTAHLLVTQRAVPCLGESGQKDPIAEAGLPGAGERTAGHGVQE